MGQKCWLAINEKSYITKYILTLLLISKSENEDELAAIYKFANEMPREEIRNNLKELLYYIL